MAVSIDHFGDPSNSYGILVVSASCAIHLHGRISLSCGEVLSCVFVLLFSQQDSERVLLMNEPCAVHDGGSANDLVARFAERYGFGEDELLNTLAQTAFRQQNGSVPTREQLLSLLSVADSYGLNPFIRQVWALSDRKGGVLPVISVDGWVSIMNSYPQSDGMEFSYPDELITFDEDMKACHPWMECVIHRKDREHAIRVREYLDELYRPAVIKNGKKFPGPWQTCPKRMLKAQKSDSGD